MAIGASYATLDELKARLGITDTSEDTMLTGVLTTASRAVDKYCNRQFNIASVEQSTARVYYPDTPTRVTVDDIATTTGLVIAIDTGDDGTYETTLTASDYLLHPLNGIVDGETGWPYSDITTIRRYWPCPVYRPSIQVTATWGWSAVPAGVKEATLIIAHETARQKEMPGGVGGFAEFGIIRARDNPFAARLLNPYRRDPVMVA